VPEVDVELVPPTVKSTDTVVPADGEPAFEPAVLVLPEALPFVTCPPSVDPAPDGVNVPSPSASELELQLAT
jgi:hypothetical protein